MGSGSGFTLRVSGQHADPEVLWPEGPLRGAPAAILRAGRAGLLFLPTRPGADSPNLSCPSPPPPAVLLPSRRVRTCETWPCGPRDPRAPGRIPPWLLPCHEDLCVLQEKLSGEARLPLSPVSFPLSSSGSALSLAASVSLSAQIMDW